jgi:hypothetical protein
LGGLWLCWVGILYNVVKQVLCANFSRRWVCGVGDGSVGVVGNVGGDGFYFVVVYLYMVSMGWGWGWHWSCS